MLPEEMRYGHRVFTTPPRIASDDGSAIEANNLTKKFGDFTAVDDVSFTIPKGEIFGFCRVQRLRQDHYHEDAHRAFASHAWSGLYLRQIRRNREHQAEKSA